MANPNKSGNPAKRAAARKVASINDFKNKNRHEVELPSGNVVLLKRIGPDGLLEKLGEVPNFLAGELEDIIREKRNMKPAEIKKLAEKPEDLQRVLEFMDAMVCDAVLQPHVEFPLCQHPVNGIPCERRRSQHTDRDHSYVHPVDDEMLFADELDLDDKVYIVQWCIAGVNELSSFRTEYQNVVASVANVEDVPEEAE